MVTTPNKWPVERHLLLNIWMVWVSLDVSYASVYILRRYIMCFCFFVVVSNIKICFCRRVKYLPPVVELAGSFLA